MHSQQKKDLEFGFNEEEKLFKFFNEKIGKCKKTPEYFIFDYEGDNFFIELKSRRIKSNKYNTTFMNLNKLIEAERNDKKVIFVFNYLDKILYWEFQKNQFYLGKMKRYDRGKLEIFNGGYINHKYLKEFDNNIIMENSEICKRCKKNIKKKIKYKYCDECYKDFSRKKRNEFKFNGKCLLLSDSDEE